MCNMKEIFSNFCDIFVDTTVMISLRNKNAPINTTYLFSFVSLIDKLVMYLLGF